MSGYIRWRGGKLATPIRDMLMSPEYNGVVFHCEDKKHAESSRYAALMLKWRYKYDLKTARRGSDLIVYKEGWDYEPENMEVTITRGSEVLD